MVKINDELKFGNKNYTVESIKSDKILLKNNNVYNWISKQDIKNSLQTITFSQPTTLTESFNKLNVSVKDSLTFENKYVQIIAKDIINEGFTNEIFYHGSHNGKIKEFNTPEIYWSTSNDFSKSYGIWIYKAKLNLGKCFDITNARHFNMLKQADGEICYMNDDGELIPIPSAKDLRNSLMVYDTWEITEHHLDFIKQHFNSARITEGGTINYIVFSNNQVKLIGEPEYRDLDESYLKESVIQDKYKDQVQINGQWYHKLVIDGQYGTGTFDDLEIGDDVDFLNDKITKAKNYPTTKKDFELNDNFKQWFRDSKIVDENGNPLVVYHGSYVDIKKINTDYSSSTTGNNNEKVFYFTSDKDTAIDYSIESTIRLKEPDFYDLDDTEKTWDDYVEEIREHAEKNIHIHPCFMRMENPFIYDYKGETFDAKKNYTILSILQGNWNNDNWGDEYWDEDIACEMIEYFEEYDEENDEYIVKDVVYDGAIFLNVIDNIGDTVKEINEYIVWNPNQIKSVYNKGIWSLYNDNIDESVDIINEQSFITVYDNDKQYTKKYNCCKEDAIKEFNNTFKYYNELTPSALLKNNFICEDKRNYGIFYHGTPCSFDEFDKIKQRVGENIEDKIYIGYHGTNADFDEFDSKYRRMSTFGQGFYFVNDENEANEYGKFVIKAKLSMKNPLIIKDTFFGNEDVLEPLGIKKMAHLNSDDSLEKIKKAGYDSIIVLNAEGRRNLKYYIVFDNSQIEIISKSSKLNESFIIDYVSEKPIIYYTHSESEAKEMINTLLSKNPVRGLYDFVNKVYLFGDAYEVIHYDLIDKTNRYGNTKFNYPYDDREIYQYLDKNCAMFKIIDENDYKSFSRSDGYKYAFIGKLDNNQYIICRNNELAPSHYNAPDELKKIQQVPLFKNIKFVNYDVRDRITKDTMPQKLVDESIHYAKQYKNQYGENTLFTIEKNPTKQEFWSLLKNSNSKELRGICGLEPYSNLYIWDAYFGTHQEVYNKYIKGHSNDIDKDFACLLFNEKDMSVFGFTKDADRIKQKYYGSENNKPKDDKWLDKIIADDDLGLLNEDNSELSEKNKQPKFNDAFWKWFGNSVYKNSKGNPLIAYHYSPNKFHEFDINKVGSRDFGFYGYGIYFSTHKSIASQYGKNQYAVYLKMEKPFMFDREYYKYPITEESYSIVKKYEEYNLLTKDELNIVHKLEDIINNTKIQEEKTTVIENGRTYPATVYHLQYKDKTYSTDPHMVLDEKDAMSQFIYNYFNDILKELKKIYDVCMKQRNKQFAQMLQKNGYDSIWAGTEIVVFSPNQIKSIKNVGTWNPNSNNIYESDNHESYIDSDKAMTYKFKQGEPVKVLGYHGTSNSFSKFKNDMIFFSNYEEIAGGYGSKTPIKAVLTFKNPYIVDAYGQSFNKIYNAYGYKKYYKDLTEKDYKLLSKRYNMSIEEVKEWYPSTENGMVNLAPAYNQPAKSTNEWGKYAKSLGYDGVIIIDVNDTAEISNIRSIDYIVFNNSQIKILNSNNTLTESQSFWADSGIVEPDYASQYNFKNFEPVTVLAYHMTPHTFNEFKIGQVNAWGKGVYLTTNPKECSFNPNVIDKWNCMELYATFFNPIIYYNNIDETVRNEISSYIVSRLSDDDIEKINENIKPYSNEKSSVDAYINSLFKNTMRTKYIDISTLTLLEKIKNFDKIYGLNVWKSLNIDGMILPFKNISNYGKDSKVIWYVCFKTNQIKSASNNNGNYDITSNNINEQRD